MFIKLIQNLKNYKIYNYLVYIAIFVIVLLLTINVRFIFKGLLKDTTDPIVSLTFLLASLILILGLSIFVILNSPSRQFILIKSGQKHISKLRKRIIIAFSIGSALPAILIAIFSTYFFNIGIQSWFDNKISDVLKQSMHVGESYIEEHVIQLKETSISISDDLSAMYYDLINNPELFTKVINTQAEMRSLDEALVFQKSTNTILAQTALSFSLSFTTIPSYMLDRADQGEIVKIDSDPSKIRILIKLQDYDDTYLLIGSLVDSKIIEHINKVDGTAADYFRLKSQINSMQIRFSAIFIFFSLILLLCSAIWSRRFAERIVKPIRELVIATEKARNGDLSVQVPLDKLSKDEIKVLSTAFNRMINQLERQNHELLQAQRSLAWSDVARRVAHEIKNPLTPIQLSAERLLVKFKDEVKDQEKFVKYTKNILRHTGDIREIVSEFVEFARLPAPNFSNCEIISMIYDLVESRKLINNEIKYNFHSNVGEYDLACDISQINRALENLLLNSEESITKEKKGSQITLDIQVTDNEFIIIVEDDGLGFSENVIDTVKEAYITTKNEGMGLGLAIVDRIIIDHYGKMIISNKNTGGALIKLIFNAKKLKARLN